MADADLLHRGLLASLIVGLGFSAYAALEVLDPALSHACSVNAFLSCTKILTSGHTTFPPGWIPDWAWGIGGFAAMIAVDIPLIRTYDRRLLVAVFVLTILGLALSGVFAYIELVVIRGICPVCVGAYVSDLGAAVFAGLLLRMRLEEEADERASASTEAPRTPMRVDAKD
jgi:uncharacterized membrane protein